VDAITIDLPDLDGPGDRGSTTVIVPLLSLMVTFMEYYTKERDGFKGKSLKRLTHFIIPDGLTGSLDSGTDATGHHHHISPGNPRQHGGATQTLFVAVAFAELGNLVTEVVLHLGQAHQLGAKRLGHLGIEDTNLYSRVLGHVVQEFTRRAIVTLTHRDAQGVLTYLVTQVVHVGAFTLGACGFVDDDLLSDVHV